MSHITYISLGTNLGNRTANLNVAIEVLSPEVQPVAISSVYETEPWGFINQPAFLNQVIKGVTSLVPFLLLAYLKNVEYNLGRIPTFHYGPRLIDLDILLYDDLILDTPELTIPHPRIAERAFVLVPLAEIAPNMHHPTLGKTIQQLLSEVDATGVKAYMTTKH